MEEDPASYAPLPSQIARNAQLHQLAPFAPLDLQELSAILALQASMIIVVFVHPVLPPLAQDVDHAHPHPPVWPARQDILELLAQPAVLDII